jgi:hypothetical protein
MLEMGMDEDAAEEACLEIRADGVSTDIDGDYTETLARINANPEGIGVFGLAFYENNTDRLQVATMSGVEPTVDSIASGEYPVSRPLFFYIKAAHLDVIPGCRNTRVLRLRRHRRPLRPAGRLRPRLRSGTGRDPGRGCRPRHHGRRHVIAPSR